MSEYKPAGDESWNVKTSNKSTKYGSSSSGTAVAPGDEKETGVKSSKRKPQKI